MKLLLTLGHNSSAIGLTDNNEMICGYEEERLNRVKSCSAFPKLSIEEIFKYHTPDISENNEIFISHWFNNYDFSGVNNKHLDVEYLMTLEHLYKFKIVSLSNDFTHHDAHARAALEFYKYSSKNKFNGHIIVADGFGNNEEVFSIYNVKDNNAEKVLSNNVLSNSLGMMYQYATSFCGMKENQDEYKFLGYESHLLDIFSNEVKSNIDNMSFHIVNDWYTLLDKRKNIDVNKDFEINLDGLNGVKSYWYNVFERLIDSLEFDKTSDKNIRTIVGYFVQTIIEQCLMHVIKAYDIENIIVSGGIFYNVKLNNAIMKHVKNFCVIPLAGDQGAAIGLYSHMTNNVFDFKDMCFGKRSLADANYHHNDNDILCFNNKEDFEKAIIDRLNNDIIVQIVCGDMEFGPRALCHTSTLMLPTSENVSMINRLNSRNDVMPMAPVILMSNKHMFFNDDDLKKVIGSDEFMIITYQYNDGVDYDKYCGIMHHYSYTNKYTGRPQFIKDDHILYNVMNKIESKALINTSFNYHGMPIVFSVNDAINDFNNQKKNLLPHDKKICLIFGTF